MAELRLNNDPYDAVSFSGSEPVKNCEFDWNLQQAILHLQRAISVTDSNRAHFLVSAKNIIQGVKER